MNKYCLQPEPGCSDPECCDAGDCMEECDSKSCRNEHYYKVEEVDKE